MKKMMTIAITIIVAAVLNYGQSYAKTSIPTEGTRVNWMENGDGLSIDEITGENLNTGIVITWSECSMAGQKVWFYSNDQDVHVALAEKNSICEINAAELDFQEYCVGPVGVGQIVVYRNIKNGYHAAVRLDRASGTGTNDNAIDVTWYFLPDGTPNFSNLCGTVTGTIRADRGKLKADNACVYVSVTRSSGEYEWSEWIASECLDTGQGEKKFEILVKPGQYSVQFDAQGHYAEWYNGGEGAYEFTDRQEISVVAGKKLKLGKIRLTPFETRFMDAQVANSSIGSKGGKVQVVVTMENNLGMPIYRALYAQANTYYENPVRKRTFSGSPQIVSPRWVLLKKKNSQFIFEFNVPGNWPDGYYTAVLYSGPTNGISDTDPWWFQFAKGMSGK